MDRTCHRCGQSVGDVERVGRRDGCLGCGADLHCCRNCEFFDPAYHNQCRETQAERQVDKERGNFCDFFRFRRVAAAETAGCADAKARLAALFAKKENAT
jgi:hypothetical protein